MTSAEGLFAHRSWP